ncbi:MAG: hypothetical protein J6A92_03435 [Lachnospiraceae bacterium]|nr:hypothetical protein [Lachnospiraceae bacterium]
MRKKRLEQNFAICGLTGWCMEILFTSFGAFRKKDRTLTGKTSVWMFPIYGMAAIIGELYPALKKYPPAIRGGLYGVGILSVEYLSGRFLKKHKLCPWDYSEAKLNVHGVIRLDYLPLWMGAGLIFERILCREK